MVGWLVDETAGRNVSVYSYSFIIGKLYLEVENGGKGKS
jgi:hypothetical protein